jgi:hypothetical protein
MKTLLASFFLVFLTSSVLFAQENSDRRQDMNKFLSKNLMYPIEARSNEVEGLVVIQVIFDEQGQPINTTVISGNDLLAEEVTRTVTALTQKWNPEYLGDRPKADSYLMSFQFKIVKEDHSSTTIKQMPMKEYADLMQNPEKQLNHGLENNPYNFKLYQERAELYTSLNLPVLAKKDLMLAEYFKKKMLTEIVIVGYQVKNKSLSTLD